jgi:Family of unknown function (DUF6279)
MSMFIIQFRRWLLIMLVVALLPACSAIKVAYNQAPDLTYWWLDSYFDFNGQQTPKLRDEINKLFAWHRANQLPKVAALLQKTQTQLPGAVSPEQTCAVYDEVRDLYNAIIDKSLPAVSELATSVDPEQLLHLQRKYQKNNDEYVREYITGKPDERDAKRLKQAVQRSEMIYGKLDDAQIAAIQRAIQKSSFNAVLGLKERQRRQKDAIDVLSKLSGEKPNPQQVQAALRAYLERSTKSPDMVYRAYSEKMVKESCDSFAAVHATTSAEQRANAVITLKSYEADMRILAAQR